MNLALIYNEIEKRVKKVDFSALWKGFSPLRFAVYTDQECYFDGRYIEKTDAFCANTSIKFNGEYIAIWNISEEPKDMDALSASMIHEMFHAFQMNSGECRFADEQEAPFKYRYSVENLSAKYRESGYIKAVLEEDDRGAYSRLLSLRKMRADRYPYEYDYEARIEQIEGTADFVEINALTQINREKGETAWQSILDRICRPENYFPIRLISYEIGAAVIACIKKCSDIDCEAFTEQPFSCEMISDVSGNDVEAPNNAEMEKCLNRYLAETHRIIDTAVRKNDCVLKGKYPLVSLNICDARCEGNYVTSNYFLKYKDGGERKTIYGNFVIEVDADYNVLTVLTQANTPLQA